MQVAPMFFIMAVVLLAPHISIADAKWLSAVCTGIAVAFWIIEWKLK